MSKIVDANQRQSSLVPCLLPTVVVHLADAPTTIGEHPNGMLPSLRVDDRPGDVIQDHNVRSFGLEGFRRDDEYAPPELRHCDLPFPLQAAYVAVAKPSVNGEERHAGEVRR